MPVLALDKNYNPSQWISYDEAIILEAKQLVLTWLGETIVVYHGGVNAKTGKPSTIETSSIIVVNGAAKIRRYRAPTLTNASLFHRDRMMCAYCGRVYSAHQLTRDHVVPTSKGGQDVWTNVVTACKPCNSLKGHVMPGEKLPFDRWSPQGTRTMDPLYLPYKPCIVEAMILRGRNIRADQMEFLASRIKNEQSRIKQAFEAGEL
jgi:5-methylcytosine-specific restriction endonuclease McrA